MAGAEMKLNAKVLATLVGATGFGAPDAVAKGPDAVGKDWTSFGARTEQTTPGRSFLIAANNAAPAVPTDPFAEVRKERATHENTKISNAQETDRIKLQISNGDVAGALKVITGLTPERQVEVGNNLSAERKAKLLNEALKVPAAAETPEQTSARQAALAVVREKVYPESVRSAALAIAPLIQKALEPGATITPETFKAIDKLLPRNHQQDLVAYLTLGQEGTAYAKAAPHGFREALQRIYDTGKETSSNPEGLRSAYGVVFQKIRATYTEIVPTPAAAKPAEPAPAAKPVEPAPAPAAAKPVEPAPAAAKPVEPAPAAKPVEPAPAAKPVEPTPPADKPVAPIAMV